MLLQAGWAEQDVSNFIEAVAHAADDEEQRQRVGDAISTARRLSEGRSVTGAPTLAQIVGDEVVSCLREWLGLKSSAHSSPSSPLPAAPHWPEPLASEAFYGLAGEFVRAIEPHSESDPAALLLQFLTAFGNIIGRGAFFTIERHRHWTNLFVLIVGPTAKGRKGTSWAHIEETFRVVDPTWVSTRIHGGVGSGEGIIWQVRDPILKGERLLDEGIADKRLHLLESEFAQVLAVAKREGSTASEVLRRGWDGRSLQTLTKNNPNRATGAHISAIGHITRDELLRHLDVTEIANGLMNRFLIGCARRSKILPEGGNLNPEELSPLTKKLRDAVAFGREERELKRDSKATALWRKVYPDLSEGRPGLFGAVISRSEAQVLRLSMLYAVLDCSALIQREHLLAALAVWQYAEDSALYVFGDALGDPVADEILRALRANRDWMTRSQVRDLFGRHKKEPEIDRAIALLLSDGRIELCKEETGGRPAQRLRARHWSRDKSDTSDQR
jgi:hypothetical protein